MNRLLATILAAGVLLAPVVSSGAYVAPDNGGGTRAEVWRKRPDLFTWVNARADHLEKEVRKSIRFSTPWGAGFVIRPCIEQGRQARAPHPMP